MGETMRRQAMVIATALLLAGTAMAATQDSSEAAAVHPELWPAAKSPAAITDPATEARIDADNCEPRSEEHPSELQSLMRISYAAFCLKKKKEHRTADRPTTPDT